jgi:hypothetical protein
MPKTLQDLLQDAELVEPTPKELEAQRRSFAYGNAVLSNPNVTRELVDKAAEQLKEQD